jgi:hypothetical protein
MPTAVAPADVDNDRFVRLSREGGGLRVDVREVGFVAVDVQVQVPRTAWVGISTVNSDVAVHGLTGDTRIRQVSGNARLFAVAGRLDLETISGPIAVQGADVALRAATASGPITLDAEHIDELVLTTLSADVSVSGALRPDGSYRIESVSGDVRLATPTGLTATLRSLSGRVVVDIPAREEIRRGERVVTVGDGQATVQVRSVSGRLRLAAAGAVASPAQPPEPSVPPAVPAPTGPSDPSDVMVPRGDDPLATLQALERGEIDVDEASRRLAGASHG